MFEESDDGMLMMKKLLIAIVSLAVNMTALAQTYFLNGTAESIGDDCYQLTSQVSNENGTVWYADQINLDEPFDIQFLMNFGSLDATGADGICFVLQTVGTAAIGESGGGLGYLNFGTSLGIEFDTWQNGNYGDPAEDHIAIEMNGSIDHTSAMNIAGPVQADVLDINIEDGEDHVVRIVWNPENQIIEVYFDCVFRVSGNIDLVNTIFNGQNLVYWGFTAATGGSWNNQIVCLQEDILNVGQDFDVCEGGSVVLMAGASIDGVYEWTPTDGLSNPNIATPSASPAEDTQYSVSFLDLCNQQQEFTFNINVEPLIITLSNPVLINCIETSTEMNAEINFDVDGNYTWSQGATVFADGVNLNSLEIDEPGNFVIAVTAMDGCYAEASFEVEADYSTYTADAGPDAVINCFNSSVILNGSTNGNEAVVLWSLGPNPIPGADELSYEAENTGTYTLNVIHPVSGCLSEDDVVVTSDFTAPVVTTGEQDSLTCVFPQIPIVNINVQSDNEYTFSWSTDTGQLLGGTTTQSPVVGAEGYYVGVVMDMETGCTDEAVVFVGESDDFELDLSSITFPNIITPNGDSKNEFWFPFLINNPSADLSSVFTDYDLIIFDRWGREVFSTESFINAWQGKDCSDGVYYYILKYAAFCGGGQTGTVEGNVHLIK